MHLNACWYRDGIHSYDNIHIATAVDTPDGLLAPVVRDVDRLALHQIADRTRQLVAQARCGQLSQNQLSGGTFTISNLGMYGIDGAPAARWLQRICERLQTPNQ